MRVEREKDRGYRILISDGEQVQEMRGVCSVKLNGKDVVFENAPTAANAISMSFPLGPKGFASIRRKMWRADVLYKWGAGKCFLASVFLFLMFWMTGLIVTEILFPSEAMDVMISDSGDSSLAPPADLPATATGESPEYSTLQPKVPIASALPPAADVAAESWRPESN